MSEDCPRDSFLISMVCGLGIGIFKVNVQMKLGTPASDARITAASIERLH